MGKSSKDKRDAYYRLAKEQGWRARSAFKLLQLDEEFDLFKDVTRVVDLCAAPGSWSQVLSRILIKGESLGRAAYLDKTQALLDSKTTANGQSSFPENKDLNASTASITQQRARRKDVRIVAIDLQPMSPLEGVTTLRADITHPSTVPLLLRALDPEPQDTNTNTATETATASPTDSTPSSRNNPVDLVISDGAPDVTGLHDLDIYVQSQLLWAALNLALCVLKPGGTFVAKVFREKDVDLLYAQLRVVFRRVTVAKPRSSRASSVEAFLVCREFAPPDGFSASLENPLGAGAWLTDGLARERKPKGMAKKASRTVRADGITELDLGSSDEDGDDPEHVRWIAPFLACGDLSSYDSDATYRLPKDRVTLDPVQPPTAPPYKAALEMRKKAGGAYGKTKM